MPSCPSALAGQEFRGRLKTQVTTGFANDPITQPTEEVP